MTSESKVRITPSFEVPTIDSPHCKDAIGSAKSWMRTTFMHCALEDINNACLHWRDDRLNRGNSDTFLLYKSHRYDAKQVLRLIFEGHHKREMSVSEKAQFTGGKQVIDVLRLIGCKIPKDRPTYSDSTAITEDISLRKDITADDSDHEATEGKQKYEIHRRRERDPDIVFKKRLSALETDPWLSCEACGLSMKAMYGDRGEGFCEVHHRTPLFLLDENETIKTNLDDLAILCPSCHRIVHRNRFDTLTVEALKKLIEAQRKLKS